MLGTIHAKVNGRRTAQFPSGYLVFGGDFQAGLASHVVKEDKTLGPRQPCAAGVGETNKSQPRVAAGNVRVLDLCCGLGGLSVAARDLNMQVVAGVDLNSSALRTFARNFPQAEAIEGCVQFFSGHRAPPAHFDEPRSIAVREVARLQANRTQLERAEPDMNRTWMAAGARDMRRIPGRCRPAEIGHG